MHTPFSKPSSTKGSDSSAFVTHGVTQNVRENPASLFGESNINNSLLIYQGTGRWADGSKEWTSEWLEALEHLGHTFGDDGAFIMECKVSFKCHKHRADPTILDEDFLDTWTLCYRARLFDPSWIVSSSWVNATLRGNGTAWDYGDISCQ